MRKTFFTGIAVALLAANTIALAGTRPSAKPEGPVPAGVPGAVAPGNSTAYERAVTAYLDNVVNKARKKMPSAPVVQPPRPESYGMGSSYPGPQSMRNGDARPTLPRVERITIGIKARAVLATPEGGRLRVSPGVVTPYGQVTAIRAAGVWFRKRGARSAVELADISPGENGSGNGAPNPGQSQAPVQGQPMSVPPPPNFEPAPRQ